MSEGLLAAIIGVGGTLLGTVVGFLLGKVDFGKIYIKIKRVAESPSYNRDFREEIEKLDYYEGKIVISLYNGSNKNRVLRNSIIQFINAEKKEVLVLPIKDLATMRYTSSYYKIDDVGVVNIPSKTGLDINASFGTRDIESLMKAKKVYLQYTNEKFKSKKKFMWKYDYSSLELSREVEKTEFEY